LIARLAGDDLFTWSFTKMATLATRGEPSFVDPSRLYSIRGFWTASGISPTRIRQAKRHGVELPTLLVGKRKFVRGADGIAFIERLAALPESAK
jgi:hypothetical protein